MLKEKLGNRDGGWQGEDCGKSNFISEDIRVRTKGL